MGPVKTFSVTTDGYKYTRGDVVSGKLTLELKEDLKFVSLSVKLKGQTKVSWVEYSLSGKSTVYSAKELHCLVEQDILPAAKDNHVLTAGSHVFPFNLRFPDRDMPQSFVGSLKDAGFVSYTVRATLKRTTLKMNIKDRAYLSFVSSEDMSTIVPELMSPKRHTKTKKKMWFNPGTVAVEMYLPKMGFLQEEGIDVTASVENKSPIPIDIRCRFYKKITGVVTIKKKVNRKVTTKDVATHDLDTVPPNTDQTLSAVIDLPSDCSPSLLNSDILKVEYRLEVMVSINKALPLLFKFPIVVLPGALASSIEPSPPAKCLPLTSGLRGDALLPSANSGSLSIFSDANQHELSSQYPQNHRSTYAHPGQFGISTYRPTSPSDWPQRNGLYTGPKQPELTPYTDGPQPSLYSRQETPRVYSPYTNRNGLQPSLYSRQETPRVYSGTAPYAGRYYEPYSPSPAPKLDSYSSSVPETSEHLQPSWSGRTPRQNLATSLFTLPPPDYGTDTEQQGSQDYSISLWGSHQGLSQSNRGSGKKQRTPNMDTPPYPAINSVPPAGSWIDWTMKPVHSHNQAIWNPRPPQPDPDCL